MNNRSAYSLFCAEVDKYNSYSNEENKLAFTELLKNNDPVIRDRIFKHNLRLIFRVTNRYIKMGFIGDLVQEGSLGLLRAIDKFDISKNIAFSTYAIYWIKAFVLAYIRKNSKIIKFGTTEIERKYFDKISKYISKKELAGEIVSDLDIAKNFNITEEQAREARSLAAFRLITLSHNFEDSDEVEFELPDPSPPVSDRLMIAERDSQMRVKINEFLKTIPVRDADIFRRRALVSTPESLELIGRDYSLTRQRIDQISRDVHNRFKYRLKEFL